MKKLPAYIMVIALLVMNIASVAHAECTGGGTLCSGAPITASVDDTDNQDQDNGQQESSCECCSTGHHHHSHASIASGKVEHFVVSNKMRHDTAVDSYLSQLNSPPFQPPKA